MLVNIFCFFLIAVMRVAQQISNKLSSEEISTNKKFFAFGSLYQFVAGAFSLITIIFTGFNYFNLGLVVCSVITAVMFALDLFSGLEAIKGCSVAVANLYSLGGLVISVVVSYFWFGEEIKIHQLIGLAVFFVSAYLLSSKDSKSKEKMTLRTFLMLIINLLSNGVVMVVQKYFALKVEGANTPLFSLVTFLLCGAFMLICFLIVCGKEKRRYVENSEEENVKQEKPILNKKLIICGTVLAFAIFLMNIVVTEMGKTLPSIIIFPISSAITVLTATLVGYFVFKEKLSLKKIIGVVVGLAAIIIIGI